MEIVNDLLLGGILKNVPPSQLENYCSSNSLLREKCKKEGIFEDINEMKKEVKKKITMSRNQLLFDLDFSQSAKIWSTLSFSEFSVEVIKKIKKMKQKTSKLKTWFEIYGEKMAGGFGDNKKYYFVVVTESSTGNYNNVRKSFVLTIEQEQIKSEEMIGCAMDISYYTE